MKKRNSTKHALLLSALSLLMCVSMLVGSTFAWFTDSVTSTGNIIKSGNLEVIMEWKDATATGKQLSYADASQDPIFNYDLWEPGYVEAKNIKITNIGTLALRYELNILATGVVSELASVIDVFFAEGEHTLTNRNMSELTFVGTLDKVLAGMPDSTCGDLLAKESDTVTIALKMQESAGNEYQGLSIGSEFAVQLLATQLPYEKDSFGPDYDASALNPVQKKPLATVTQLPEKTTKAIKIIDLSKNPIAEGIDTGYSFQPTESYEQSLASEHSWAHADFYVYADKDVPANSMVLAGYYSLFGEFLGIDENTWIGLTADTTIPGGEENAIRLLKDGMGRSVAYNEICNYGNDGIGFLCGASDLTGENEGTTITVELRLYEVTCDDPGCHHNSFDCETGKHITVGTFKYTF